LDTDGNRFITYDEFILALVDRDNFKKEENIEKCFKAMDISNNGKLSLFEMETEMRSDVLKEDKKTTRLQFYKYSKGKNYVSVNRSLWKNFQKLYTPYVKLRRS
jgi:Ca2+-binding EF-hand superfamily protein